MKNLVTVLQVVVLVLVMISPLAFVAYSLQDSQQVIYKVVTK